MLPFISPGLIGAGASATALPFFSNLPETAAGATGAAGAATANPLLMLLPALFSLLQNSGLFGGNDEDEKLNELLAMMKPTQRMYQSPNLSKVDPVVMQALMNQMRRSANWGWPEGMGMDTGFIPQNLSGLSGTIRPK
jgi:hypothetical protein